MITLMQRSTSTKQTFISHRTDIRNGGDVLRVVRWGQADGGAEDPPARAEGGREEVDAEEVAAHQQVHMPAEQVAVVRRVQGVPHVPVPDDRVPPVPPHTRWEVCFKLYTKVYVLYFFAVLKAHTKWKVVVVFVCEFLSIS